MIRTLTATITAAAVALGATTAPAVAQTDEELLGRILAGAAILGITAKIIDDRKDRKEKKARAAAKKKKKKKPTVVYNDVSKRHRYDRDGRRIINGEISRLPRSTRSGARKARNRPLPRDCRVVVDTPRGDRIGYSSRCMRRNFDYARYLPPECEVLVRTSRGIRGVYGERCLARDGWKTVRR